MALFSSYNINGLQGTTDLSKRTASTANYTNYVKVDSTTADWAHCDAINMVFADGHCGSAKRDAGLPNSTFLPF